jgi:hypothetical protein
MTTIKDIWGDLMAGLNEAEIIELYEMLGDSIRMRQELNLMETPDSEGAIDFALAQAAAAQDVDEYFNLVEQARIRHRGERRN